MNRTEKAIELHPSLQCANPSLGTQTRLVINRLADEVNVMVALIELLKTFRGLREPDKYGDKYTADRHLQLIGEHRYDEAHALMVLRGKRPDQC